MIVDLLFSPRVFMFSSGLYENGRNEKKNLDGELLLFLPPSAGWNQNRTYLGII